MRKNYIDNLRVFCILLLFPYHTGMLYNDWGEAFYIHSETELPLTYVMSAIYPWWMTLLFVIAGISAYYALSNRSTKEFLLERVKKLLIPLLVGVITIVPMQTYIADMTAVLVWMQYITICFGTFLISVLYYEIIRRSRLLRRA